MIIEYFKCKGCGRATPEEEVKIQDKDFKFLCAKCDSKRFNKTLIILSVLWLILMLFATNGLK